MNVYVDTEQLKTMANSVAEVADHLNETMNKIENLILNLGVEWHGKSAIAYTAKILFIRKQFNALYEFFIDYAETIRVIGNDYEKTETQLISQLEV